MRVLCSLVLCIGLAAAHKGSPHHHGDSKRRGDWAGRLSGALAQLGVALAPSSGWHDASDLDAAFSPSGDAVLVSCVSAAPSASDTVVLMARSDDSEGAPPAPVVARCADDSAYLATGKAAVSLPLPAASRADGSRVHVLLLLAAPTAPTDPDVAKQWAAAPQQQLPGAATPLFVSAKARLTVGGVAGAESPPAPLPVPAGGESVWGGVVAAVSSMVWGDSASAAGASADAGAIAGSSGVSEGGGHKRYDGKHSGGGVRGDSSSSSSAWAGVAGGVSSSAAVAVAAPAPPAFRRVSSESPAANGTAQDAAEKANEEAFQTADADIAQVVAFVGVALLVREANKHARGGE